MRIIVLTMLAALAGCGHVGLAPAAVETTQLAHVQFWQAASRVAPVAKPLRTSAIFSFPAPS